MLAQRVESKANRDRHRRLILILRVTSLRDRDMNAERQGIMLKTTRERK